MHPEWRVRFGGVNLGFLPVFLNDSNPKDAVTQLNEAYAHGGGWHDFQGFTLIKHGLLPHYALSYPGDPPMRELARAKLRDETVVLFEASWVAVIQPDETFRVARMD
jgi:hypothetical protein